jgi:hypothetical protein
MMHTCYSLFEIIIDMLLSKQLLPFARCDTSISPFDQSLIMLTISTSKIPPT